jgi:hypothetical protein
MRFVWIPEHPSQPVYRVANYKDDGNYITYDPNAALQFATKEECEAWCRKNAFPRFVAREHGFA